MQNLLKLMYKSEEHTLFVPNLLSSTISAFPCPLHQEQVCDQQDTKSTDVLLKLVLHVDMCFIRFLSFCQRDHGSVAPGWCSVVPVGRLQCER